MKLVISSQISQMIGPCPWNTRICAGVVVVQFCVGLIHFIKGLMTGISSRKLQSHFAPVHKNGYTEVQQSTFPINRCLNENRYHHPRHRQRKKVAPAELGNGFGFLVKADQFVHKIVFSIHGLVYHETRLEREQ